MIHAYVQGNYVKLDNKNAGVRGESNVTALALHFSPEWSDFSKRLLWKDSRGQKVVSVVLTPVINKDTAAGYPMEYHTEIPYEALAYMGWCSFIVEGFLPNDTAKVAKSVTARMYVQENEAEGDTPENTPAPTPSEIQQLQAAVDNAIGVAAADKAAAEQAAADANAAKTGAETAKAGAETAKAGAENAAENAGTHEAGAKDAAEKSESARKLAESYTNHPPVPGGNGNWQVWDGEKYVDSGKKAIGKDGTPGYTPVKGKDYFDGAPGYTPVKGKDYFDGANGVSPTVEVAETEGGHMVAITDANGTKEFEVLDGAGGQVWLTDSADVPGEIILISALYKLYGRVEATYDNVQVGDRVIVTSTGAVVEVVAKHESYGFYQKPAVSLSQVLYYMDGYANGQNGVSPTVEITEIDGGHRVTITDAEGEKFFDVLNGEDGVSPTVGVSAIDGGFRVTITDAAGKRYFDVMNGAKGDPGFSPTVAVEDIDGGHRITITDAKGEHTFDVMDGEDGSGGGTGGAANGLIGTSFAAGADMNTLVPSGSNNYEVFWSNATSDTPYVNAPPDRAEGYRFPTVIAVRFGVWGTQIAQYYYCLKTPSKGDGPCEVWMRTGSSSGKNWDDWQQVYPVQSGGVTSWNDLTDKPFGETGIETVLSETAVAHGEGQKNVDILPAIIPGNDYRVTFDGVEYKCVAELNADVPVYVTMGSQSAEDPFPFTVTTTNATLMGTAGFALTIQPKEEGTHTIKVDDNGEILSERTGTFGLNAPYPTPMALELGEQYVVTYDGVDYPCECKAGTIQMPVGLMNTLYLGNAGLAGGENTDEPFAVANIVQMCASGIMFADGQEHTIRVRKKAYELKKLDSVFLESPLCFVDVFFDGDAFVSATKTFETIVNEVQQGAFYVARVRMASVEGGPIAFASLVSVSVADGVATFFASTSSNDVFFECKADGTWQITI